MDVSGYSGALRETLDYMAIRLARAESLCKQIRKLRAEVESARLDLDELEARETEPSLPELQEIIGRLERAQLEWDDFARRLGELWSPGKPVH